jgi:Spy/CpxP family protein refolding chaperone
MNQRLLPWSHALTILVTGVVLLVHPATAADAPPPPPTGNPPPADAAGANRGNRPDRRAATGNVPGGAGFTGGRGNFGGGINLDDKQRELLREAMQQDNDELRKLAEKLRAAQKELMQAVLAEKYEEKIVREKAELVARIQTDMTLLRARAVATLAPTLKPEQREQLESSPLGVSLITGVGMAMGAPGGQVPQARNNRGNGGPGGPAPDAANADQGRRRGPPPGQ